MEHINRIELKGRVGTVRSNTFNDNRVVNFSMVTDYLYRNRNGEPISDATWFNVVAWEGKDICDMDKVEKAQVMGKPLCSNYIYFIYLLFLILQMFYYFFLEILDIFKKLRVYLYLYI